MRGRLHGVAVQGNRRALAPPCQAGGPTARVNMKKGPGIMQGQAQEAIEENHPSMLATLVGGRRPAQHHDVSGDVVVRLKREIRDFDQMIPTSLARPR
jgi:hypothetical protein